ncbi:MAG TPA: beta-L-arabinofuranosidase domain-containing protein [Terracidiphilus sp.]|jgi:DUF1680 family protein
MIPLAAASGSLAATSLGFGGKQTSTESWAAQGELGSRYELTLHRVLDGDSPAYTDDFLLADVRPEAVRRFTDYSGDLSGRYIGALATASIVYGQTFPGLDALVKKVIALQKPDGYFGSTFHYDRPTDEDLALLWGNGRLLVGLLEYYRLKPSQPVLTACRRLGDWLVRIGPLMLSDQIRAAFGAQHFASSYICWMQQTEGLANLYVVTKDERYRKLGEQIAAVIERRPGDHVHGYLTSLRGVMGLYEATGDGQFLTQCEAAWQEITRSKDALITGGVPEGWSPNNHRTEGCAEADWARLNLTLWSATGKRTYLETAERTVFNELAFNQFATGDFGHRVYTDTGFAGSGAARAWWCCTLHGLRAFPAIHVSVFRATKEGLWYDLPMDGRIETGTLAANAESSLGENGTVRITITSAGTGPGSVFIRKPQWAAATDVHVRGNARQYEAGGGYVGIEKVWTAGEVIELNYAMNLRTYQTGEERSAYFYGPWLLGASAADNLAYFNELTVQNRLDRGKEKPGSANEQMKRPFRVPIGSTMVPYVPAEFPDQPGTVALRAVSEQTGMDTAGWELKFLGLATG